MWEYFSVGVGTIMLEYIHVGVLQRRSTSMYDYNSVGVHLCSSTSM